MATQNIKTCQHCQEEFTIEPEDFSFYKKFSVPEPGMCPTCREQRRLSFYNELTLYNGTCGKCNKGIITSFNPDSPFTVYCMPCWWGDQWDPLDYGKELDLEKSFFDQLGVLSQEVPKQARQVELNDVNSDFTHCAANNKNCYLIFHADENEDCYYGYGVKKCKDCVDIYNNFECQLCYNCIDCHNCYGLQFSQDCVSCNSGGFLKDCVSCQDCFGCVGLRNKQFCLFNEQLTKDDYQKRIAKIDLGKQGTIEEYRQKAREVWLNHAYKYMQGNRTENASGNNLYSCTNVHNSYDCRDVENGRYCFQLSLKARDCYDYNEFGLGSELIYNSVCIGINAYNVKCSFNCVENISDLEYCFGCFSCQDCFGCVALRKKQYCILNKQYSRDEYHDLRKRLIQKMTERGEYGQFIDPKYSYYGYNETVAHWWYPLTKKEAAQQGLKWQDNLQKTTDKETTQWQDVPEHIKDVSESICKEVLACAECGRNYKIVQQELAFYKKHGLALPNKCFNCRHMERFSQRNPRKLWRRQCVCDYSAHKNSAKHSHHESGRCPNEFETTYAPERKEIVYCEQCYQAEVV